MKLLEHLVGEEIPSSVREEMRNKHFQQKLPSK